MLSLRSLLWIERDVPVGDGRRGRLIISWFLRFHWPTASFARCTVRGGGGVVDAPRFHRDRVLSGHIQGVKIELGARTAWAYDGRHPARRSKRPKMLQCLKESRVITLSAKLLYVSAIAQRLTVEPRNNARFVFAKSQRLKPRREVTQLFAAGAVIPALMRASSSLRMTGRSSE